MEEPSLLDVLKAYLSQPLIQRRVRLGLASLAAGWGVYQLAAGSSAAGVLFVLGAAGLALWGLSAHGAAAPMPAVPGLTLPALPPGSETVRFTVWNWLVALRLPWAVGLAVIGQAIVTFNRSHYQWGLAFYALATIIFIAIVWRDNLRGTNHPEARVTTSSVALRPWLVALALLAAAYAWFASGGNQFRFDGVLMWLAAMIVWLAAFWEGTVDPAAWVERLRRALRAEAVTLRLSQATLALLAVLAVGAYFRYARLDAIPSEMTSDHIEKLLDVNDVLNGQLKIFFERNTGREPMQFYAAALVSQWLHTGLTHLTLKMVTATAGFLLLPFVYLLGREIEDHAFGLLAALLAGISYWATTISRVGLRFPLTPLFVAPVLLFLLRGLRRGTRNDFLLAGLFLGAGLHGYSPYRIAPVLVGAAVLWFALWPAARGARMRLFENTVLLYGTALVVFAPLLRYAMESPRMFWYRTLTRVGDSEKAIAGSPLLVFLSNQWRALQSFNWQGDVVWVNTVPLAPLMDFISGALFILGAAYLLWRLLRHRDWTAGLLLLAAPLLMLPSTLSLAFPIENPSAARLAGVIPVVFLVAAYPLWLMYRHVRETLAARGGAWVGAVLVSGLAAWAGLANAHLYFDVYPPQYAESAENASEIGAIIRGFAHSIGSYDHAFVRPYPYWVDTRVVEVYAGNFGADAAITKEDLSKMVGDPKPKLYFVHPQDSETVAELRQLYPSGTLSLHHSPVRDHDFLIYFVPGTEASGPDATPLP